MIRSVLLALDGIVECATAIDSAIAIARGSDAALEVALTLDRAEIADPEAHGAGGDAFAERRDAAIVRRLEEKLGRARSAVEERVRAAGLTVRWADLVTDPRAVLPAMARAHDVLVLSHALRRHEDSDDLDVEFALPAHDLVTELGRPLVLADAVAFGDGDVLIADDGGAAAARAIHAAVCLGVLKGRKVSLLTVEEGAKEERRAMGSTYAYLATHGIDAEAQFLPASGDPTDRLLERIDAVAPSLVVMGAFGHRSFRTWLFGSTTSTLFERCVPPVLVSA